ncbi:MAG: ATP-binding protein [Myxococcales bacterium]|nr:hypothetical protein [Myxococcales bacterium]MCB9749588.1 ATP-binding protein [Myxococcales bacterium]
MDWTIGNIPSLATLKPELVLTFYPQSFPLRWGLCSTTADFCADYLATREPFSASRDAINYVLNELVENAVKFSEGEAITITLALDGDTLVLLVTNHVGESTAEKLYNKLCKLLAGDPLELLMRRVEENAENPDNEGSGLGFLTMMTDYEASLGWRLTGPAEVEGQPLLSTVACLKVAAAPR